MASIMFQLSALRRLGRFSIRCLAPSCDFVITSCSPAKAASLAVDICMRTDNMYWLICTMVRHCICGAARRLTVLLAASQDSTLPRRLNAVADGEGFARILIIGRGKAER